MSFRKRQRKENFKPTLNILTKCPSCSSIDVVYDHRNGSMVCRGCGRVLETHRIDFEKDWFDFEKEVGSTNQGRASGPDDPLMGSFNMTTRIENTAKGRALQKTQNRSMQNKERKLRDAFKEIDSMCQKINLHKKFTKSAKILYKDLSDKNALRGRTKKPIFAACIYAACKLEGSPTTLKEIVALANIPKSDLTKSFQYLRKKLDLNKLLSQKRGNGSAMKVVPRFCQKLKLSMTLTGTIEQTCENIDRFKLFIGRHPDTIAASVIYLCSQETENEKRTAEQISEFTGVGIGTIKTMYSKDLLKIKKKIIPKEFFSKKKE